MKLSANRVALIFHQIVVILTIAAVFIAATSKSLPQKWQAYLGAAAVVIAALLAGFKAVETYLNGSQKFDALQSQEKIAQLSAAVAFAPDTRTPDQPLSPDQAADPLVRGSLVLADG